MKETKTKKNMGRINTNMEMIKDFELGQFVTVTSGTGLTGKKHFEESRGKVISKDNFLLGIEFDKAKVFLHDCGGDGKSKHCYWVYPDQVTPVEARQI